MSWQFTVGLRVKGKADRMVVDAEDALIAALKAKADQPGATIMYVRRSNDAVTHVTHLALKSEAMVVNGCTIDDLEVRGQPRGRRLD